MILEAAILNVKSGQAVAFEAAMAAARPLIAASKGCEGMEDRPGHEDPNRYLPLVRWARLEDHTEGFRGSERYQDWKAALHHFYEPFPSVEHYGPAL